MDQSDDQQKILFDRSGIDACINYLKSKTDQNLERLVFADGNRLAYRHHMWFSIRSRSTISDFWKKDLERIVWSGQLETSIKAAIDYLMSRRESQWLNEVLGYLPEGHVFKTTVYLIGGYDNVVYGKDVALNLGFKKFHADHREIVYYLIHELAHAGYFKYHRMPDLAGIRTVGDLSDVVKLLTHLEGMGVISPFRLRIKEGGLLEDDYTVLLNEAERDRRVHDYFAVLSELDSRPKQKVRKEDFQIFETMSGKTTRLSYITGCHMARKIEEECGIETLRDLVKKGHEDFFRAYREVENPPSR
jgi:hypothetical protein